MTVMTVTNRKGGVGKTTLSTHLAAGLATVGFRVALIDTDSQGHCAATLQMPRRDALYEVMVNQLPIEEAVEEVPPENYTTPDMPSKGRLYLLAGADRTHKIPYEVDQGDVFGLLNAMDTLRQHYNLHVVIIDTNPTLTALDSYIYMATDAYIYVTEVERLASEAVDRAIAQMRRFATHREQYLQRRSTILGIIPNKMRSQTTAHQIGLEELHERYGEIVWPPIRQSTIWVEASLVGQLVYNYAPATKAAQDAWDMVKRALERLKEWQKQTD